MISEESNIKILFAIFPIETNALQHFTNLEELDDNRFEVTSGKHKIIMDTPIQIGCAVYQLAKLKMLQFYYDCLDKYVDRSDFQYVEMDTDSAYLALSADKLDDVIKPIVKRD